ncbi:ELWxxDGT repeat protein [Corallococcus exiguus]|uniref:Hyalin n=1 Tax=Corallococcus exiguus TaxID=83462 RepID=A0A7X4YHM4_9BACT|nr:ELWxxDGT repeat protein [Corallococcus exiguus]NBC45564.1 hypothetical protein [Corallococcus exiguus]TNV61797.1 hypothetical protein FH620_20110 [Corallococcus exiguus]
MRMRFGWVLAGLSFVGCGGAPDMEPPAAQEQQVQAQACTPAMAATKVKDFLSPGDPLPSPYRPIPEWLTNVAGTLYFTSDPYQATAALWRSDGTPVGTVPVKELPSAGLNYRDFASLTAVGSRVFFTMNDPAAGSELWVSDGTAAGTRLVKDITPGASSSSLSNLTALGDVLTFFRYAGTAKELWRSDGTAAGTYRVVDFGSGSSLAYPTLRTGSALLFFFQDATQGTRLWRTDGTAAGTWIVKRVDAGTPLVSETRSLASGGGVFTLDDSSGTEVWRTDGSAAGTVRVTTSSPGGERPEEFTRVGTRIFFRAYSGVYGSALWAVPTHVTCTPLSASAR